MRSTRSADPAAVSPRVIAALLFTASATFVWWRTTQVAVLVDLGYIVNIATAVAHGEVPYRDFPLVNAPGEFLVQGALIKLLGAHYQVQVIYASLAGGAATLLTYLIARRLLAAIGPRATWVSAVLTLPLIPLGIYAILPNPFYDPDACLAVLASIALLLSARARPSRPRYAAAGAVATIPLFIGQNIGGAFLVVLGAVLFMEALSRSARWRELRWLGLALGATLLIETAILQAVAGLDNFLRWTWTFALSGRGLSLDRIHQFADPPVVWVTFVVAVVGIAAPRVSARPRVLIAAAALTLLAASLVPASFAGPAVLIPPLLLAAAVLGLIRAAREGATLENLFAFVLLATTIGTVEAQGISSSSYGIFPLLCLALACVVRDFAWLVPRSWQLAPAAGTLIALGLVAIGGGYTLANDRLRFIDVNAPGPPLTSTFPSLGGLSARGPYVAELDAILFWMRDHIPSEDSFTFLPGEDPAFFALERKPALPSVYFFDVATPYTPAEIADIAARIGLRWVIVKDRLQLTNAPPLETELEQRLTAGATLVTTVGPYRVYRRS
jgi:hypothetical protein